MLIKTIFFFDSTTFEALLIIATYFFISFSYYLF